MLTILLIITTIEIIILAGLFYFSNKKKKSNTVTIDNPNVVSSITLQDNSDTDVEIFDEYSILKENEKEIIEDLKDIIIHQKSTIIPKYEDIEIYPNDDNVKEDFTKQEVFDDSLNEEDLDDNSEDNDDLSDEDSEEDDEEDDFVVDYKKTKDEEDDEKYLV